MLSNKSGLSYPILIISLIITGLLAFNARPEPHYPNIEFTDSKNIQVNYLLQAHINKEACQEALIRLNEDLLSKCPTCVLQKQQCLSNLTSQQRTLLSNKPLPFPSIRSHDGAASYLSADSNEALNSCLEAETHSNNLGHKIKCHVSNSLRAISASNNYNSWTDLLEMCLILAISSIASWFICYLILRYESLHSHYSHDHINSGPQKFHSQATPRIGGIALLSGLLAATAIEITFHTINLSNGFGFNYFIIASLPAFFGGVIEDVTKNVGIAQRLLFTMLSAAIAIWLLGALVNRVDIPAIDYVLLWIPASIALTILAVSGACNAINIIDGYNGLSAGYSVIALTAMSCVAFLVNDHLVMMISIAMLGSILGFLKWNWPHGKIFMGDGGAYLLGFTLSELAVLLLYRNPLVSPWFVFTILAYPVFETLFSIYRRKIIRKTTPGHPDALHLHQLIYKRIVRGHINAKTPEQMTKNNSSVAPYIWSFATFIAIIATFFWQSSVILMSISLAGSVLYIIVYLRLISFGGLIKLRRKRH